MDRPRLRPYLTAETDDHNPEVVLISDHLGLCEAPRRFSRTEFVCLQLFTGEHNLDVIHQQAREKARDAQITLSFLEALIHKLEGCLFLDSPRFRRHVDGPVREPRCIGCYSGDPDQLRRELHGLFTGPHASGLPRGLDPDDRLRAVLVPHIDYARGGRTYTWAFKELVERSAASLFVIIGTSHYSSHRFTLTRKHFKTPLGTTPTDQDFIDRLERHYGPGLFDDEWMAHLPEHSIELEVVLLQYLYEKKRPIRIVPLVVGSFFDCIQGQRHPYACPDIQRMIQALHRVEEELSEPVCYVISGDLAHIGPKFGDRRRAAGPWLEQSRDTDFTLLQQAEWADPDRLFGVVAAEEDARRICGLPPSYVALHAARPARGKLLDYDQYVHPHGFESVSFASMAFYR